MAEKIRSLEAEIGSLRDQLVEQQLKYEADIKGVLQIYFQF